MRDHRYSAFNDDLRAAGLLVATDVEGIPGWSGAFHLVMEGLYALTAAVGEDRCPVRVEFPPVMPRSVLERSGYMRSFPQLVGSVHAFTGDDRAHADLFGRLASGEDWSAGLAPAEVVLAPAACHPLYPTCAGRLPDGGRHYEVRGWCFRHEPSPDPARLQSFRMHEHVYLGAANEAVRVRDGWVDRGLDLLGSLGLEVEAVVANDPFFGRAGTLLAEAQRQRAQKVEIVTPICSDEEPTAVMSANYHRDHFGEAFGIVTGAGAGEPAHSTCTGFGMERIVLALFHRHGLRPAEWPSAVRDRIWR